ncbi:PIN-like domain-containing protein [Clostridium peptidivorans]|uniref:PIN-like domain-containing protein n=1 Tax=Clostridium peptidivorans TaxID=100174 RepID=UPI000BE383EC|nr:PIN-like domain-containing protein [Clostridium peptidivorans]
MAIKINTELSFGSKLDKCGIKDYKDCLKEYSQKFDSASKLENNIPTFLDTNVLLQIYKVSLKSRESIVTFFQNNKERIYIANQVQQEFVKNRLNVLNEYFELVSDELCKDYEKEIINSIQRYYESKKGIFEDFEEIGEEILATIEKVRKTYELLKEKIGDYKKSFGDIEYNDENLNLFSSFNILDSFDTAELDFLRKEFDNLSKKIKDKSKVKEFIKKNPNEAFPGGGDLIEKPDNPYGDYFIYHEILKFMKEKDSDAVLLTFDTTKGDWMKEDKTPHIHYVLNAYLNTGKFLYILDAKRTFSEVLNIKTNSMIDNSIYRDFDKFRDYYLGMWNDFEGIASAIAMTIGISIEYFHNPDVRKVIEHFVDSNFYSIDILEDLNELTYIKRCLIEEKRVLVNALPTSEKKRIISRLEFIINSLPSKYI